MVSGAGKAGTVFSASPGAVMGAGANVAAAAGVVRAGTIVSVVFGGAGSTGSPTGANIARAVPRPPMGVWADVWGGA